MKLKQFLLASLMFAIIGCNTTNSSTLADSTPPSPTPPAIEQATLQRLLQNHAKLGICPDSFNLETAQAGSKIYQTGDQTAFVMVQCFLAAYQGNYEFFSYTRTPEGDTVKRLPVTEFTQAENGQWQRVANPSVGGMPEYNPAQRQLTIRSKYRGLGDCGSVGTYAVENAELKLTEFKAKAACDGQLEPFETIYPQGN